MASLSSELSAVWKIIQLQSEFRGMLLRETCRQTNTEYAYVEGASHRNMDWLFLSPAATGGRAEEKRARVLALVSRISVIAQSSSMRDRASFSPKQWQNTISCKQGRISSCSLRL